MTNNKYIRRIIPPMLCAALLTGCGSSNYDSSKSQAIMFNSAESFEAGAMADNSYSGDFNYDSYYEDDYNYHDKESNSSSANVSEGQQMTDNNSQESSAVLTKEMLVYSCNMTIDVLDYDTALDGFRNNLNMYGGFIENENFSDGGSTGRYYSSDAQKWRTYTATVRVPSGQYELFCDAAAQLGDLRSKNANVQNVSQEYRDLATSLEIYEAKEERYIRMLSQAAEDEYAIEIERSLTDIQIEIANIKTRMNRINTDVAYSYVYITVNEVKEYTADPAPEDTFGQRLSNTLADAGEGFLWFLQDFLFLLIYLIPYAAFFGIIIFAIVRIVKAIRKSRRKKKEANAAAISAPQQPEYAPVQNDGSEQTPTIENETISE